MSVEFKIANAGDLVAQLKAFKEDVAVSTVRGSTRRIAQYLLMRVKHVTPAFTGKLRFNLGVKTRFVKRRSVVAAHVFVNTRGKADNPRNAFYWRFVEFGHKTRPSKKGNGKGQRDIPGQEFVTKTMLASQAQVAQMFFDDLQKSLDRAKRRAK